MWGGIFYAVGRKILGWPLHSIAVPYAVLEVVILLAQVALYRSERIIDYGARVRRRMQIGGLSIMLLWTALFVWLLSSTVIPWRLALVCWLGGLSVGFLALWMAFKTPLSLRSRNRPNSE